MSKKYVLIPVSWKSLLDAMPGASACPIAMAGKGHGVQSVSAAGHISRNGLRGGPLDAGLVGKDLINRFDRCISDAPKARAARKQFFIEKGIKPCVVKATEKPVQSGV